MAFKTLIKNATLVTLDPRRPVLEGGNLLVEGGRLAVVSPNSLPERPGTEVIEAGGKIVLPGLINTHVHTSQQLARGLGDDVPLLTWLHERIWPYERYLTEEDSYLSALLCGIEQIRSGVTAFAEPAGRHVHQIGRAVEKLGLRAVLSRSTMDGGEGEPAGAIESTDEGLSAQEEIIRRWHNRAGGRVRVWFGLRTIFNASDELITRTGELAARSRVGIQMHVAEVREEIEFTQRTRGRTPVEHLEHLGVLGENFLAVHAVWLTDHEIEILARRGVKVSHNPAAAMRLLGFARIPEMIEKGVVVSIGTDGAPSNNRMSLIDEMWLTSLIHKGRTLDPAVMPAETILRMATIDGARCLLWEEEIGSLEAGKKADLVIIDPLTANMLPVHDLIVNLVTAMKTENVQSVMVGGRWVMRDQKILTVDEGEVFREAISRAAAIRKRAGIELPGRY